MVLAMSQGEEEAPPQPPALALALALTPTPTPNLSQGINGSGKHNNFSLGTDDGKNLFNGYAALGGGLG